MATRRAAAAIAREEPRARLDVDERRKQLVALGIELFSERPYDDVSIDELARAAGISKGLLYHYFPTKRDFYVATVRAAAADLLARTDTPAHMDPLERLRTGLDAYYDYVTHHGAAYSALLQSGIGADAEVARIVEETREAFCARLVEDLPVESRGALLRIAARGWLGFVEAATLKWLGHPRGVRREAMRELMIQVLLGALQTAGIGVPPKT